MKLYVLVFIGLLFTSAANAEIKVYQWVDEDGNSHFSNIPDPELENEEVSTANVNVYPATEVSRDQQDSINQDRNQQQSRHPQQLNNPPPQGNDGGNPDAQDQDTMPPPPPMED